MSDVAEPAAPAANWPSIFGRISPDAKIFPGALAIILAIGLFLVTSFLAAIPAIVPLLMSPELLANTEPGALPATESMGFILLIAIAIQFPLMIGAAILMAKAFERRSLASIGFSGPSGFVRYLRGLGAGVGMAILLMVLSGLALGLSGVDMTGMELEGEPNWARLQETEVILALAAVIVIFLIQSAAEEIVMRGWLMSSLAARWTRVAAVFASSLVFGLLHFHFFMVGVDFGLMGVAAVTALGVVAAFWALTERGIYGACGLHGGFNVTAIGLSLVALVVTSDESLATAFAQALEANTGVDEQSASMMQVSVQLALFGVAASIAAFIWSRSTARRAQG